MLNKNKELIKQNAIRVFNSLKGKKQKNFFKEIQLARFLGKDFEEEYNVSNKNNQIKQFLYS